MHKVLTTTLLVPIDPEDEAIQFFGTSGTIHPGHRVTSKKA